MQAKMSVNKAVGAKAQRSPATPLVAAHASVSPLSQRVTPAPQQAFPQMARALAAESKPVSGVASRSSVVASAWPSHVSPAADKGKTVIVTGASSGLGLQAARALAQDGWHVVMACRDFSKAEQAAALKGIPTDAITILHLDLASLESVRQFVGNFRALGRPLDVLVANAAVYLPTAKEPTFNADGYELSVATNHLGHFLLCNLLLEDLKASKNPNKRMIIVGSITGQANTLAGKIPPQADLGQLQGMEQGFKKPISMIDGGEFNGAKAYKDSKVCNMLTMREFNRRYASSTGVTFSSLYPGCIAETGLFRNHVKPFQVLFPAFQKYVTKGYVSEEDAGKRLAKVVSDPSYNVSGAYWSWKEGDEKFVNEVSNEVSDEAKGRRLWELSEKLVGIKSTVSNDALGRQRVSVAA